MGMGDDAMEPPPQFGVNISNSFIRGGCDLFLTKHTLPGLFEIENSVVALDGLVLDGSPRNGSLLKSIGNLDMPAENSEVELRLEHVTCLLGNSLVRTDSGGGQRELLPVHVSSARNNILAARPVEGPA